MLDFRRAGLWQEKQVSYAFFLREQADSMPVGQRGAAASRNVAYIKAAEAFLESIPRAQDAEKKSYSRNAAQCFENGGDLARAGQAYLDAEQYELSAQLFRKAGMFDEAVDVISKHQHQMQGDVAQSIMDVSKIHFLRENKLV